MNKLFLLLGLLVTSLSWSQYSIQSIQRTDDNFCAFDFESYVITVSYTTTPPSMASLTTSNQGLLNVTQNNPFDNGSSVEFYLDVYDNGLAPTNGQQNDSLFFQFLDGVGLPITALDTAIVTTSYGDIIPTIDFSSTTLCSNGLPIDLSAISSPAGGVYSDGNFNEMSSMFNPAEYYQQFGASAVMYYDVVNSNGCSGGNEIGITINISPTVTPSTNPSSCGTATGDATVNITPGTATGMMQVYWSTGFMDPAVSTISTISNLSSGVYYANVTDALGCKAVGTAQISDVDMVVTNTITTETCSGMNDGVIDLTITGGGNVTQTFWSNGATTEDMIGHAGEYSVEIHTDNNCNAFGTYIIPDSKINISNVLVNDYDCMQAAPGSINLTTSGGTGAGTYSWSWTKLNDAAWTDPMTENISGLLPGVYTCTVTDGNACQLEWSKTVKSFGGNAYVYVNSVTKENCGMSNGAVDVTVGAGTIASWNWSTGATSEDITNLSAGSYSLEYTDDMGCVNYLTAKVPNVKPYQPQICVLTVDTSLTYNKIVWEKDPNNVVNGFNIYRETTNYGEFELIATVPYSSESAFIDNEASPNDRSWRYFMTTFDGCDESYGSFIHKTIHVVIESTDLVTYNLAWDDYEGITYTTVDLWRFDATNGWQLVANLPAGTNTYADQPTDNTDLNYMVSFNLASTCTSSKAIDHNASRSNTTASIFEPGGDTDLSVIENEDGRILMYPNPTSDFLNISIENSENYKMIKIVNMNGQVVYEEPITNSLLQISTFNFSSGIYFVQIYSENNVVTEKIVKQ